MKNLAFLFLSLLLVFSCKGDDEVAPECEQIKDLGEFYLIDSSKDFVPYSETLQKIIFTDAQENEYEGTISQNEYIVDKNYSSREFTCPDNPDQTFKHSYTHEYRKIQVDITSLNLSIDMRLIVTVSPLELDENDPTNQEVKIHLSDSFIAQLTPINDNYAPVGMLSLIADSRNSSFYIEPLIETLNIHGVEFNDVYTTNWGSDLIEYSMYYTEKDGIVGIEKLDESLSLKFDRVE